MFYALWMYHHLGGTTYYNSTCGIDEWLSKLHFTVSAKDNIAQRMSRDIAEKWF